MDQSASAFVHNMPRRGQRSLLPLRSIREVRQRMSTVADSSLINVTNLRDVIDVPVPVIDVGDSSLRVPSLLCDVPTSELCGILSTVALYHTSTYILTYG